jgi:crotonobetainyl-CoA:carnitine CoA-transferase CaiB-like acyl-CoA transferase
MDDGGAAEPTIQIQTGAEANRMLEGVTVLDASLGVAGNFCGRLFADHGADVTLVEPSTGSPLRRFPPFDPSALSDERSFLFRHLNTGKRGVRASEDTAPGDLAEALAASSDLAITDDASLADRLSSTCATCLIVDFSRRGPWASWKADELVHQALGGSMLLTGLSGRPPLYGVGHRAAYGAGVAAYSSSVAALLAGAGPGTCIEVSIHQVTAAMAQNVTTQYEYSGVVESRDEGRRARTMLEARDGWVAIFVLPGTWNNLCKALGDAGLGGDPRFKRYPDLIARWAEARSELARIARNLAADDVVRAANAASTSARRVLAPSDLLCDDDLVSRGFWERWDSEDGGLVLGTGFSYEGWQRPRRPAPRLDVDLRSFADSDLRKRREATVNERPSATLRSSGPRCGRMVLDGVLHGVRVLDLTTAWAGPMATRILAALGASVVKVEAPYHPDGWRGQLDPSDWWMYPEGEPGDRPFDRNAWFNTQNAGKCSVVLNLRSVEGRRLVRALAVRSDLVIANSRPGILRRLGLDRSSLAVDAPTISVIEMPPYGTGGPSELERALGPTMEAAAGISHFIGYFGGGPLGSGPAYVDPMSALHGAAAALTALVHRRRTGHGLAVEVAQREAAMHWIGEWLLEAAILRADRLRIGNEHPTFAPHGAYPCAGEDQWIAISVHDDVEWRILMSEVGRADLGSALGTSAGRRRRREEIDDILGRWTSRQDKWELARRLQAKGVRAAPVSDGRDLALDEDLLAAGFFVERDHPAAGCHRYPGVPIGGLALQGPTEPAPGFGAHTREVLHVWLGLDDEQLDALERSGVIATEPTGG